MGGARRVARRVARRIDQSLFPPLPHGVFFLDELDLNPVTPWPTIMLHVRVRRQIDAETKSNFPATLADTESTYVLDSYHESRARLTLPD